MVVAVSLQRLHDTVTKASQTLSDTPDFDEYKVVSFHSLLAGAVRKFGKHEEKRREILYAQISRRTVRFVEVADNI